MARRRLGRGLDGLLPAAPPPSERPGKNNAAIEDLHPGNMQPRTRMDAEALAELRWWEGLLRSNPTRRIFILPSGQCTLLTPKAQALRAALKDTEAGDSLLVYETDAAKIRC